ncbi:hypothetical protein CEXT_372281 [Caerostris extrusa]|uniref:Uncharacterized protein n=1 Tax=Caerostris extrusa TaxID=172846 RepID=A0AAV4QTF3_CAEEX|nr:hypothetical protein CEXT_372281 [Caerostris extrusa]
MGSLWTTLDGKHACNNKNSAEKSDDSEIPGTPHWHPPKNSPTSATRGSPGKHTLHAFCHRHPSPSGVYEHPPWKLRRNVFIRSLICTHPLQ